MLKGESISKRQQASVVQYILDNYEDIQKIEFKERTENHETGFDRMVAIVNDGIWLSFQISHKTNEISMSHLSSRNNGNFLKKASDNLHKQTIQSVFINYLGE